MIDVNQAKYHILLDQNWRAVLKRNSANLEFDEAKKALHLEAKAFRFPRPPSDKVPQLPNRRGAARDTFGNWYWVDQDRQTILTLSVEDARKGQAQHFWHSSDLRKIKTRRGDFEDITAPAPQEPYHLGGLTVTTQHYLAVGVVSPSALLVFDLHAGGQPLQYDWPLPANFSPFEIAPLPDGGIIILDRAFTEEDFDIANIWFLNCYFQLTAPYSGEIELQPATQEDFNPVGGETETHPAQVFPLGMELRKPDAAAEPIRAIALDTLPDGSYLILEDNPGGNSIIYWLRGGTFIGEPVVLPADKLGFDETVTLRSHDFAVSVAKDADGSERQIVFVVDPEGNQSFAFQITPDPLSLTDAWRLEPLKEYYPMRLFSGKGLVSGGNRVYYDSGHRWVPLVRQLRPRFEEEGVVELEQFDGKAPQTVWHRLFIDGCIPAGTEIVVESRAADKEEILPRLPWNREPRPYLRPSGDEFPFSGNKTNVREGIGTWELLFQNSKGRYQQLRLTLRGDGRTTPFIRVLRSYYPRFSYLNEYLPAVYREDATSASFLERFLGNVEGFFTVWEGSIANSQLLFDTRTVPSEYLAWLGGWFGISFDPAWHETRRRLFLKHAIVLFNQRGTIRGILNAIRLALDPCPVETLDVSGNPRAQEFNRFGVRIVEQFLLRKAPGVVFGDPQTPVGPGVTTELSDWTPDQGAGVLHNRYRNFLRQQYAGNEDEKKLTNLNSAWGKSYHSFQEITFTPIPPSAIPGSWEDWRAFIREGIGFTYTEANPVTDVTHYRAFLGRRHKRIERLRIAHQLPASLKTFADVRLPTVFREVKEELIDWVQFVSIYLPTVRAAHRFTVLVPTRPEERPEEQQQKAEWVRRIVHIEKPAHTTFEVSLYWAMMRAGFARLGIDTVIEQGARFTMMLLNKQKLAGGFLKASSYPWNVTNRQVAGRDRLGVSTEKTNGGECGC